MKMETIFWEEIFLKQNANSLLKPMRAILKEQSNIIIGVILQLTFFSFLLIVCQMISFCI